MQYVSDTFMVLKISNDIWIYIIPSHEELKYTGLEHQQTLRALTLIVICQLKLKINNWKYKNFKKKIGNLETIRI